MFSFSFFFKFWIMFLQMIYDGQCNTIMEKYYKYVFDSYKWKLIKHIVPFCLSYCSSPLMIFVISLHSKPWIHVYFQELFLRKCLPDKPIANWTTQEIDDMGCTVYWLSPEKFRVLLREHGETMKVLSPRHCSCHSHQKRFGFENVRPFN